MNSRSKNAEQHTAQKENKESQGKETKLNSTSIESTLQDRGQTFHVSYFINQILQTCAA